MKLSSGNTLLICSNTNSLSSLYDQAGTLIQLRDNIGNATLLSKFKLYSINNIDFWILNFNSRNLNSTEINLFITDNKGTIYFDGLIAKLNGSVEDQETYRLRTMKIATSQIFEKDDFRIAFYGWTPPPIPITPNPSEVPQNITINENATISIENISTQVINYLAIRFLSNGQVISDLIK